MKTLYFPLTVGAKRKSIKLSDSASLIRIDVPHIKELIGVRHVELDASGYIAEISHRDEAPWYIWTRYLGRGHPILDNILLDLTNFVLAVENRREALLVAFAMKLIAGTRSGPYIGFSDPRCSPFSVVYLPFSPHRSDCFLALDSKKISLLRKLLAALNEAPGGGKLDTLIEKYCYAESAGVPSTSLRFLELAVILEMIFLPKANAELSYRFQLRVAKWFRRHQGEDVLAFVAKAKRIYTLRSHVAHSGTAKISGNDMDDIRHITRTALRAFVLDASMFEDRRLEELCLLG